MYGQRERIVRFNNLEPYSPRANVMNRPPRPNRAKSLHLAFTNRTKSIHTEVVKGSEGLVNLGKSLRAEFYRLLFPEDLKVSEKKIFDPQDRSLLFWNRLFVMCCIIAVSIDPLFFYLPIINRREECIGIDQDLAGTVTSLRTFFDGFYILRIFFKFKTAYIAPSSRVFGRGELVIDPAQIEKRYLQRYFIFDFLSVLPIPQTVVGEYMTRATIEDVIATKRALRNVVFIQYIPRFIRFYPLTSDLKKTAGVFAESAWAGAAYYLLWFLLSSHKVGISQGLSSVSLEPGVSSATTSLSFETGIAGALWYLFAVDRVEVCWLAACIDAGKRCKKEFLYCGNGHKSPYWTKLRRQVLGKKCIVEGGSSNFNFGIYTQACASQIVESQNFFTKFCYCLWWGLQNLSTLGQGLETSTYYGEVLFCIFIAISGLILLALLIGNMQTYLQSLTIRLEEMRIKKRDSEQWMHHRLLPEEIRERVRRYNQYKWLETRGVDEESLVQSLPKDLRRDIKRHLCLNLVRRVPLFENMDERLLDAICERLTPSLFPEYTYVVREGDPVEEMLFIIRGRLESVTTDGGRSGFYNRGVLKGGDFCGEELLTWALDPKAGANFPLSTRTVKALQEVEAFALKAEDLKFVASQFRRLHSRQVQHTFRFYSQQWRTWASCFIQAAWRRYVRRKISELKRKEEEEESSDDKRQTSLGATIYASRFAANALRRLQRVRSSSSPTGFLSLHKPSEPNFDHND